uniref:Uncharacterized protein n=1 Tax=Syphacia muris TaxID=451379 RepID=A0A158R4K4_9BILA
MHCYCSTDNSSVIAKSVEKKNLMLTLPCDYPINCSRNGTLTLHTFRPQDYPHSTIANCRASNNCSSVPSPLSVSSSRTINTPFEANAYRPATAYYQRQGLITSNIDHQYNKQRQAMFGNGCYENGYYFSNEAPDLPISAYEYNNYHGNDMLTELPTNSQRAYTYIEECIEIHIEQCNERVGFSMSGGADENLQSIVNSVLPGKIFADYFWICCD